MLEQARKTGRLIILTQRGMSTAVILDIRRYQARVDELDELRDITRGTADADADRVLELEEARKGT